MNASRILVVDQSTDAAERLCIDLSRHNYQILQAQRGSDALSLCSSEDIALAVVDEQLPDMTGLDFCSQLKASQNGAKIDVIVALEKGQPSLSKDDAHGGVAKFVTKPLNLPMLMVQIDALLQRRNSSADAQGFLVDMAYTDALTGLRNRRYMLERLDEELAKARRYNYPVTCAVFDVNDVRPLDDQMGTPPLDDLLVEVAMILRSSSRMFDVLARYDDTVLAAVLPHTDHAAAVQYAHKIRTEARAALFLDPSQPAEPRLSMGIACSETGKATSEELLAEAMCGLLHAKSHAADIPVACKVD